MVTSPVLGARKRAERELAQLKKGYLEGK